MSTPADNSDGAASPKKQTKLQERSTERSDAIRARIKDAAEHAEEERKRELFKRRLSLARKGVAAMDAKRYQEATANFHTYIKILEDWKATPHGGLTPAHFDHKLDLPEMMLITGVYWDLVKLYDRSSSAGKKREFMAYLEKYIVFSKGMPYQALSKETLRKYLNIGHPKHVAEFKHAYKVMGGNNCYVITALSDLTAPSTLGELRSFRDEVLSQSWWGRGLSDVYYKVGPTMAILTLKLPVKVRARLAKGADQAALIARAYRSSQFEASKDPSKN